MLFQLIIYTWLTYTPSSFLWLLSFPCLQMKSCGKVQGLSAKCFSWSKWVLFTQNTVVELNIRSRQFPYSHDISSSIFANQAFKGNIVCPNKYKSEQEKVYKGRMLESETYIGGHVECLESGVFRSDLPTRFHLTSKAYQVFLRSYFSCFQDLTIIFDSVYSI